MVLKIEQIHPLFAANASGVDLSQPLSSQDVDAINAAMDKYAVLVFRNQPLTQTQLWDLANAFGTLDAGLKAILKVPDRMEHEELADISNLGDDGKPLPRDHGKTVSNIANQLWHSDSSFQKPAAQYSMLSAVQLPEHGGDTEFADLRAAYDGLPEETRQEIEGLEAEHYALHSRALLGDLQYSDEQKAGLPPVYWPLVRVHPGSNRKLLFAGIHTCSIKGWSLAEGRMMLMDLLEHATQRQFVFRHKWQLHDLVIWDNRSTLHRGRRFDFSKVRELRRATTLDLNAPELAAE